MDQDPVQPKKYVLKRVADARDGASHPRTAAAPAAAPKLVRRTYLDDPTPSHVATHPRTVGSPWTITIHDFGKRWVEASWGKAESRPGKRGCKGQSPFKDRNEIRARARAVGEIRRKCITIGADHLVTLTYRKNVQDRMRVLEDLERLHRMLKRGGKPLAYVNVLECQQRGAIHAHLGVRGFQDVRFLRRCWYKIVGNQQGQVNVEGPRRNSSPVKLGRYLSKYISKEIGILPREFGEHRYFCSLGIAVPTERYQLILRPDAESVPGKLKSLLYAETLRRIGDHCSIADWTGSGGTYGWVSGYHDPSCRWFRGAPNAVEQSPSGPFKATIPSEDSLLTQNSLDC
ncbi:MAG: hypothetical protein EPO64_11425 [Nitrospirae bacterium]|nr:MAG: hypothetical protein EPO64_11425 [Nitrospirota bacterium]